MANSITNANAIDPILTGLFYELFNQDDSRAGLKAAPIRTIDGLTGQYHTASGDFHRLNLDLTDGVYGTDLLEPMPMNAPSRELGMAFGTSTVTLERYSDSVFVNDFYRADWQASGGFDVMDPAMTRLVQVALDRHNYKVMNTIYSDSTQFGTSADPGDLDTVTTAYFDNIHTAIQTIVQAIGLRPTHAFTSLPVAQAMVLTDQVRNRSGNGNVAAGAYATMPQLQAFFNDQWGLQLEIDSSSHEAAAGTAAWTMGNHIAIVFLSDQPGAPSFCNTFVNGSWFDEATTTTITEDTSFDPPGTKLISNSLFTVSVENSNAGYLLTDVLT